MGTRHQGSKAETVALDAYLKLIRAADSVTARAHVALPDHLTLTQFGALEALYHLGPLFQSELASKLLKSGGNLTLVVKNLERDGLVSRTRETGDRRFIKIELTPKGRRFIGALFPKIAACLTREFSILSARDQLALARICKRLGRGRLLGTFVAN
jgi:MarR family 2-MHQ and catechol resistance regulon transcriptional repressor